MIGEHPFDRPQRTPPIAWHAMPADDAMKRLSTGSGGLTATEAAVRLSHDGRNELAPPRQPSIARLFLRQFNSPLIYLLIAAAAISLALNHRTDAGFIAVVLVINALIATVQERKAETSLSALRRMIGQTAHVRRDGALGVVDAGDLVTGDMVEVESGMAVPADLRLCSALHLSVDQSTFSGESVPVQKDDAAILTADAAPADRVTMLNAGTMVSQGRGVGVVVATGPRTQFGAIDASLRSIPPTPPPLVTRLSRLARQISIATIALIVPFALVLLVQGRPGDQILLLAVALAVSAIPEGLSIAVTVALAAGTRRMAKRQVIVRSLPAVEGLGACTLIASDKTGTLTQNRLSVEAIILADGTRLSRTQWPDHAAAIAIVAHAGAICNEASLNADGEAVGDTVDIALLNFAREGRDGFEGDRRSERERRSSRMNPPRNTRRRPSSKPADRRFTSRAHPKWCGQCARLRDPRPSLRHGRWRWTASASSPSPLARRPASNCSAGLG